MLQTINKLVVLLTILALFSGCSHELSPEEQAQIAQLRASISQLDAEIAEAEERDRKYSGGLVKGLIATRIEVLRVNRALLDQRIHALESGAEIEITVQAIAPDPTRAIELVAEIKEQERKVAQAAKDAARYTGGLVSAMKQTTLSTEEQSLAMLRQSYLQAKYGLFYPATNSAQVRPATSAGAPSTSSPIRPSPDTLAGDARHSVDNPEPATPKFEILDIDAKITERNNTWSKFSWQLTVRNLTESTISFRATIEFLDSDGFVIDDDTETQLVLRPFAEDTFRGYDLVDADVAGNVEKVNAKVKLH